MDRKRDKIRETVFITGYIDIRMYGDGTGFAHWEPFYHFTKFM